MSKIIIDPITKPVIYDIKKLCKIKWKAMQRYRKARTRYRSSKDLEQYGIRLDCKTGFIYNQVEEPPEYIEVLKNDYRDEYLDEVHQERFIDESYKAGVQDELNKIFEENIQIEEKNEMKQIKPKVEQQIKQHPILFLSIIVAGCVIGFPFFMDHYIIGNQSPSTIPNSLWVSFLGSYTGGVISGLLAIIGVFFTIRHYKKQDAIKRQEEKEKEERKRQEEKEKEDRRRQEEKRKEDRRRNDDVRPMLDVWQLNGSILNTDQYLRSLRRFDYVLGEDDMFSRYVNFEEHLEEFNADEWMIVDLVLDNVGNGTLVNLKVELEVLRSGGYRVFTSFETTTIRKDGRMIYRVYVKKNKLSYNEDANKFIFKYINVHNSESIEQRAHFWVVPRDMREGDLCLKQGCFGGLRDITAPEITEINRPN